MSISKKTISIICASGTQMTVAAESSTVGKDEEIKVCVTASSGESMSYIKADLTYDPAMLELVGTSTDLATGANGEIQIVETLAYGETERTYELTFKALEVGPAEVSLHDAYIEGYESAELTSLGSDSTTIEVVVNNAISEDARIKELDRVWKCSSVPSFRWKKTVLSQRRKT